MHFPSYITLRGGGGGAWHCSAGSDIIRQGGLGEIFKTEQLGQGTAQSSMLGLTDPDNREKESES